MTERCDGDASLGVADSENGSRIVLADGMVAIKVVSLVLFIWCS